MNDPIVPPVAQYLKEDAIRGGMDLLLFGHQSQMRHSDDELANLALGRAHHRCLYFIARRPGLSVGDLMSLLGVTKQSLRRTVRGLEERRLIELRAGETDRRQRLFFLTENGKGFEQLLFDRMHENMSRAYIASGETAVKGYWILMQNLMSDEARQQFAGFHART